jgi:hypothetical protein
MSRVTRRDVVRDGEIAVVHCIQRCVRQAYLAGKDEASGKNFEHRREWIRRRLELVSAVFGIDLLVYSVMNNHFHLIVRTRPDIVKTWSDQEVAKRWLQLFPGRRAEQHLGSPVDTDLAMLLADKEKLETIRCRLSSISWLMRAVCEPIARQANQEDEKKGRFFEGRFKAQRIVDEVGLLACSLYVDLNPVRAALADTLEEAKFTSAFDRIAAAKGETMVSAASQFVSEPIDQAEAQKRMQTMIAEGGTIDLKKAQELRRGWRSKEVVRIRRDGWLASLEFNANDSFTQQRFYGAATENTERLPAYTPSQNPRASDNGFLEMSQEDYIKLLQWTGQQKVNGKPGRLQSDLPSEIHPILGRLGIEASMWCDLVWNYRKYLGKSSCAGRPENMRAFADRRGRKWARGARTIEGCFTNA